MVRRYKRSGDGDCNRAEKVSISDITDQFMELNKAETATPNKKNVEVYRELQCYRTKRPKRCAACSENIGNSYCDE